MGRTRMSVLLGAPRWRPLLLLTLMTVAGCMTLPERGSVGELVHTAVKLPDGSIQVRAIHRFDGSGRATGILEIRSSPGVHGQLSVAIPDCSNALCEKQTRNSAVTAQEIGDRLSALFPEIERQILGWSEESADALSVSLTLVADGIRFRRDSRTISPPSEVRLDLSLLLPPPGTEHAVELGTATATAAIFHEAFHFAIAAGWVPKQPNLTSEEASAYLLGHCASRTFGGYAGFRMLGGLRPPVGWLVEMTRRTPSEVLASARTQMRRPLDASAGGGLLAQVYIVQIAGAKRVGEASARKLNQTCERIPAETIDWLEKAE